MLDARVASRAVLKLIESFLQLPDVVLVVIAFIELTASEIDPIQEFFASPQQFDSRINGVRSALERAGRDLLLDESFVFWGDIDWHACFVQTYSNGDRSYCLPARTATVEVCQHRSAPAYCIRMPDDYVIEHGTYVDLQKASKGTLKISLTDDGRHALGRFEQIRDQHGIDAAIRGLLEGHLCSGWEEILPEEIGALTSAMLLSDDVQRDDDGRITRIGRIYFNPSYQVMDEIRELRERSCVVLDSA